MASGASSSSRSTTPHHPLHVRGNALFREGRPQEALACYQQCVAQLQEQQGPPGHLALLHSNCAACHCALQQWGNALHCTQLCLRVEPTHPKALLRQAQVWGQLGQGMVAMQRVTLLAEHLAWQRLQHWKRTGQWKDHPLWAHTLHTLRTLRSQVTQHHHWTSQGEALLNGYEALAPVKVRRVSRKNTIKVLHQYVHQLQEHEASTTLEEIIVGTFLIRSIYQCHNDGFSVTAVELTLRMIVSKLREGAESFDLVPVSLLLGCVNALFSILEGLFTSETSRASEESVWACRIFESMLFNRLLGFESDYLAAVTALEKFVPGFLSSKGWRFVIDSNSFGLLRLALERCGDEHLLNIFNTQGLLNYLIQEQCNVALSLEALRRQTGTLSDVPCVPLCGWSPTSPVLQSRPVLPGTSRLELELELVEDSQVAQPQEPQATVEEEAAQEETEDTVSAPAKAPREEEMEGVYLDTPVTSQQGACIEFVQEFRTQFPEDLQEGLICEGVEIVVVTNSSPIRVDPMRVAVLGCLVLASAVSTHPAFHDVDWTSLCRPVVKDMMKRPLPVIQQLCTDFDEVLATFDWMIRFHIWQEKVEMSFRLVNFVKKNLLPVIKVKLLRQSFVSLHSYVRFLVAHSRKKALMQGKGNSDQEEVQNLERVMRESYADLKKLTKELEEADISEQLGESNLRLAHLMVLLHNGPPPVSPTVVVRYAKGQVTSFRQVRRPLDCVSIEDHIMKICMTTYLQFDRNTQRKPVFKTLWAAVAESRRMVAQHLNMI